MWKASYNITVHSSQFCCWCTRYADNRFTLINCDFSCPRAFEVFLDPEFYRAPITLETVNDNKILGFLCNASARTLTIDLPSDSSCYRSPRSAGADALLLSGFKTRLTLIRRFTYPKTLVSFFSQQLAQAYIDKQFHPDVVWRLIQKLRFVLVHLPFTKFAARFFSL